MYKLVLIRHGESRWNQENRFTGWQDVDLSEKGRAEASAAGRTLKENGFVFDVAWTSVLKRAIRTCWTVQEELDLMWIPVHNNWRLNERHYGALTGLDKAETAARHGEEQVKIWRRSYDTPPPPMGLEDPRHPKHDAKYQGLTAGQLPSGESLKDTVARVLPAWDQELAPAIRQGKRVLMVAHGNSLRALIQHLEKLTPAQIMEINVPTGVPLLYELNADLSVISRKYLGDQAAIEASMSAVAKQGKAKT